MKKKYCEYYVLVEGTDVKWEVFEGDVYARTTAVQLSESSKPGHSCTKVRSFIVRTMKSYPSQFKAKFRPNERLTSEAGSSPSGASPYIAASGRRAQSE